MNTPIQSLLLDKDIKAPPHKIDKRKRKKHMKAFLRLDDHCLVLDCDSGEDPSIDLDTNKDQQLDLIRSNT